MAKKLIESNMFLLSKAHERAGRLLPDAIATGFERIADASIVLLFRPTRKWKGTPKIWRGEASKNGVSIHTDSLPYYWTNFGTRPHPIDARNAPFLVFRGPYKASTRPNVLTSRLAKVGKEYTRVTHVDHPGTTPRNFTGVVRTTMTKRGLRIMADEIKQVIDIGDGR
jgi:hypothetical protein